jgi:hypothetical protein
MRETLKPETEEVPTALYRQARQKLLNNQPLIAESAAAYSVAQVLTEGELKALQSVGLATEPWQGSATSDPLQQSIADFMALLETSYTTTEAAKYLGVDASRIRQRLRERSLFGIDYDGEKRLPRFQFERKRVIPGLREVIGALPEDLNPLDVAEWLLSPNPDLEMADLELPVSPRDWLLRGQSIDTIVALVQGFE